jgi:hypothetical protein
MRGGNPCRAIRLDTETAAGLGVVPGAVVELVNVRGAPLRAWVTGTVPESAGRTEVDPIALRMLGVSDGAEVEIRAVHAGALGPDPRPT